jgi:glycine/D-amino acid oxidase-like deaminating enzyme
MVDASIFSSDFSDDPFWWIAAPRPAQAPESLPSKVDVAIVGSGVTGLNAARELARAGRKVLVIDAAELGVGASSRNAGNIGRVLKYEFSKIKKLEGLDKALAYYREMQTAYDTVEDVVTSESIACHYQKKGRLILSYTDQQQRMVEDEAALKKQHLSEDYQVLGKNDVARELGTDSFVGGVYLPDSAAFHPGLYHLGLIEAAERQGVAFAAQTMVTGIERTSQNAIGTRFRVSTSRGPVDANEVIVATNGYSKGGVPSYFKRRLIPFDAYMIAISVPEADLAALTPSDRVYIDANRNLFFFRRSPDNRHLLFGGRTGSRRPEDLRVMGEALYRDAVKLLPALSKYKVSRAWTGRCAGTFDLYPHIGEQDGIHYAAGYCFAGMPMGTYLGRKLAYGLIGKGGETIFRERSFPSLPGYTGNPWFMPYYMKYYDWLDRRDGGFPA